MEILEPIDPSLCEGGCATCAGSPSNCLTCTTPSETPLLQGSSCVSECSTGSFESSQKCYSCASDCADCASAASSGCIKCASGLLLTNGICTTECVSPTKASSDGQRCESTVACTSPCQSCSADPSYCFSCASTHALTIGSGSCVTDCPGDTFRPSGGSECQQCDKECAACEGEASACQSCKPFYVNNKYNPETNVCAAECPASMYAPDAFSCASCDTICVTCNGSASACTSCSHDPGSLEELYLHGSACVESCPNSHEENMESNQCEARPEDEYVVPTAVAATGAAGVVGVALVGKIVTRGSLSVSNTVSALLPIAELVNRLVFLGYLWAGAYTVMFGVTFTATVGVVLLSVVLPSAEFWS